MAYDKTITLKFTGYRVYGTVHVLMWGGGEGMVEMKPFYTYDLSDKSLKNDINDGGFGVEKILSADLKIFEDYQGYEVFLADKQLSLIEEA